MKTQLPILIFLLPFLFCFLLPILERLHRTLAYLTCTLALLGSAVVSFLSLIYVSKRGPLFYEMGGWLAPYGIEWRLDPLSSLMAFLVTFLAGTVILATRETLETEVGPRLLTFYMTTLLLVSGLLGIILTNDLFNLYVFLEVSSLSAYALIASGHTGRSYLASFRYLILGTIGALLYLLGVGYLYAATGTLNMTDMLDRLSAIPPSHIIFLGVLLIYIGLLIKIGLFPFHGWLPDAYAYASHTASALIAPLMTKVAIYALIRIHYWVLAPLKGVVPSHTLPILLFLAVTAVIIGSLMAFIQQDFKRMLAYSSISHIGLIMMGVALNSRIALLAALLHLLNHAFMKGSLFLTAAAVDASRGIRFIHDFSRMRGQLPWTRLALCSAALSMIGIPPFCGFFSKWYLFWGALNAGAPVVGAIIVGASLLSGLYFFKVLEQAFFVQPAGQASTLKEDKESLILTLSNVFLASFLLVFGVLTPLFFNWAMVSLPPGELP